jgi:hypothetical protein
MSACPRFQAVDGRLSPYSRGIALIMKQGKSHKKTEQLPSPSCACLNLNTRRSRCCFRPSVGAGGWCEFRYRYHGVFSRTISDFL